MSSEDNNNNHKNNHKNNHPNDNDNSSSSNSSSSSLIKTLYDQLKETNPLSWQMVENVRKSPPISLPFRAVAFSHTVKEEKKEKEKENGKGFKR
ncbi:MAG: hypothetical protein ACJ703_04895 [Nitrososphaera sp.]